MFRTTRWFSLALTLVGVAGGQPATPPSSTAGSGPAATISAPARRKVQKVVLPGQQPLATGLRLTIAAGGGGFYGPYHYITRVYLDGGRQFTYVGSRSSRGYTGFGAVEVGLPSAFRRMTVGAWLGVSGQMVLDRRSAFPNVVTTPFPRNAIDLDLEARGRIDQTINLLRFAAPYLDHDLAFLGVGLSKMRMGYQYWKQPTLAIDGTFYTNYPKTAPYRVEYRYSSHVIRLVADFRENPSSRLGAVAQVGMLFGTNGTVGGFLNFGGFWKHGRN